MAVRCGGEKPGEGEETGWYSRLEHGGLRGGGKSESGGSIPYLRTRCQWSFSDVLAVQANKIHPASVSISRKVQKTHSLQAVWPIDQVLYWSQNQSEALGTYSRTHDPVSESTSLYSIEMRSKVLHFPTVITSRRSDMNLELCRFEYWHTKYNTNCHHSPHPMCHAALGFPEATK